MTETKPADQRTPEEERAAQRAIAADAKNIGPNATTEPADPKEHYFVATDGTTHVNAWGEVKGSPEDKKRWS